METFSGANIEQVLKPRQGIVSVLFCDVRGFARQVEQSDKRLLDFLGRVGQVLNVMTRAVMNHEGVVADFQGDAVLAFWGWPKQLDAGPLAACRAALEIQSHFAAATKSSEDHPLAGFTIGIGIGHGRAVAGKIGSQLQAKVGVFGPVVNLASRLEGMTKQFQVPILIDDSVAGVIRQSAQAGGLRCRWIGRFLPKGLTRAVEIGELLPLDASELACNDQYIREFEAAARQWRRHERRVCQICKGKTDCERTISCCGFTGVSRSTFDG